MIIETEQDVTKAVLAELERAPNARFREVMAAFVRHLHDFAREVKLTEEEFREAMNTIVRIGQASNETHNEAVLMAGSLGLSQLVVMLNNGDNGQVETDASLLGPFWRMHSPPTENGGSIVRSPTPGDACSSTRNSSTRPASRSPAPRSTSGIRRPKVSTRTRTRCRPT